MITKAPSAPPRIQSHRLSHQLVGCGSGAGLPANIASQWARCGGVVSARGHGSRARRLAEAAERFRQALELQPDHVAARAGALPASLFIQAPKELSGIRVSYRLPKSGWAFPFARPTIESFRGNWKTARRNNHPMPRPFRRAKMKLTKSNVVGPGGVVAAPGMPRECNLGLRSGGSWTAI